VCLFLSDDSRLKFIKCILLYLLWYASCVYSICIRRESNATVDLMLLEIPLYRMIDAADKLTQLRSCVFCYPCTTLLQPRCANKTVPQQRCPKAWNSVATITTHQQQHFMMFKHIIYNDSYSNLLSHTNDTSKRSLLFHTWVPELQAATADRKSLTILPGPLANTVVGPLTVSLTKSGTIFFKSG
jgi:hypothetical protein